VISKEQDTLRLDLVAGLVAGTLLLVILLVILTGTQIGIRVSAQLSANRLLGPYDQLTFKFSEPVDGSLAIGKFSTQPAIKGKFEWVDLKTLRFIPSEPYQANTSYTISFKPGALTKNGDTLKLTPSWRFQVRKPLILFLVVNQEKRRLWTIEPDNGMTNPLTDDSFKIFDFDASPNGEFVIFSAVNGQNGIDLWRVNRAGDDPVLMLSCGSDHCSTPVISPDSHHVAYVRESRAPMQDLSYGPPRVHIFDLETKQDASLYEDQQIIGINPSWSPDGTRIASYDGIKDEYRLLDLVNGSQSTIASSTGGAVTWSADSSMFVYIDADTNEYGLHTQIRGAKLTLHEITTLFGERDDQDYNYSSLAWSPNGDTLIIGLRPAADNPEEALWMMNPATLGGQTITNEHGYIYGSPIWDPWGKALLFTQFKLKGVYKPEICIWKPGMESPRVIAEGMMPHWLP